MKKLFSFIVIASLVMSSSAIAFAGEPADGTSAGSPTPAVKAARIERAEKLGVDITGMTKEEAKAAIYAAVQVRINERAEKLGVDITGMTREEARAALKAAVAEKLQVRAEKLGVDISGLSNKDARALIKQARAERKAEKAERAESQEMNSSVAQ